MLCPLPSRRARRDITHGVALCNARHSLRAAPVAGAATAPLGRRAAAVHVPRVTVGARHLSWHKPYRCTNCKGATVETELADAAHLQHTSVAQLCHHEFCVESVAHFIHVGLRQRMKCGSTRPAPTSVSQAVA